MQRRFYVRCLRVMLWSMLLGVLASGCTQVQPWEKGNLARRHMRFDPDPLEARYTKKVFTAKEGTSGGYGVGGGGCGCN